MSSESEDYILFFFRKSNQSDEYFLSNWWIDLED